MPAPITLAALAGVGAVDQVPMLTAAAARTAIHRRECSEIFLKLSIFAFELKSCGRHEPYCTNMQAHPIGNPDPIDDAELDAAGRFCTLAREGAENRPERGARSGPNPPVRYGYLTPRY